MKQFNLEHQWKLYLQRSGLDEGKMPADQIRETKRAFYGACGQMLVLLRDDAAALPEDEAISMMQNMLDQVGNFWLKEAGRMS